MVITHQIDVPKVRLCSDTSFLYTFHTINIQIVFARNYSYIQKATHCQSENSEGQRKE